MHVVVLAQAALDSAHMHPHRWHFAPLLAPLQVCKLSGSVGHNDSRIAGGMHKAIPLAHVDLPGPH